MTLDFSSLEDIPKTLSGLSYRHQILEACLLVEEAIDELLTKCLMRGIEKTDLYSANKKAGLSLEQKLCLFELYVESSFWKFPRMLQKLRNKVVHNRKHSVNDNTIEQLFKELDADHRKKLNDMVKEQHGGKLTFSRLPPSEQLTLLTFWFVTLVQITLSHGPYKIVKKYASPEEYSKALASKKA